MTLQERIAEILKRRPGTTQADFVRLTKRSRTTVSFWFNGPTQTIPLETATILADYAGLAPKWVAFGEGPMVPMVEQDKYKNCSANTHSLIDYLLDHPNVAECTWSMIQSTIGAESQNHAVIQDPTNDKLRDKNFTPGKAIQNEEHAGEASKGKQRP